VFYHLWFVYVILGLYIATPILRVFVRAAEAAELAYFVAAWLLASSFLPLAGHFLHVEIALSFYVAEGYCGYFLLGHVLRTMRARFSRGALGCALGASALFTTIATRITSGRSGALDPTFFDYLAPNIVLMSMAAFLLCRDLPHGRWRHNRPAAYRWVTLLAGSSWGIYLVHPLFMETLQRGRLIHARLDGSVLFGVLGIPLVAMTMLAASLGLVLSMRRVKGLASIVP
jgi:surface polysaccharide O-acyltransferase-like enzyme